MTATKTHKYTALAEICQQLKTNLSENMKLLKQKSDELKICVNEYESVIEEFKSLQENITDKSKDMRKTFHEDIDKHFDAIDERIDSLCKTELNTLTDKNQDAREKTKACVDLAENVDTLLRQNDSVEMLAQGEQLLSQAKELLQAGSSIGALEIPQVRLKRGQDWSLEGAVDLEITRSHRTFRVSTIYINIILLILNKII